MGGGKPFFAQMVLPLYYNVAERVAKAEVVLSGHTTLKQRRFNADVESTLNRRCFTNLRQESLALCSTGSGIISLTWNKELFFLVLPDASSY